MTILNKLCPDSTAKKMHKACKQDNTAKAKMELGSAPSRDP